MNFKKWVKRIQTADYNGAWTVYTFCWIFINNIPILSINFISFTFSGKLTMKACTFDRSNCAGKAFDAALVKHFAEEFKSKTKLDPFTKPRSILKLATEAEKVKKQMSAGIAKYPINIECFMEERDFSASIDRATFEELITNDLQKIEQVTTNLDKKN